MAFASAGSLLLLLAVLPVAYGQPEGGNSTQRAAAEASAQAGDAELADSARGTVAGTSAVQDTVVQDALRTDSTGGGANAGASEVNERSYAPSDTSGSTAAWVNPEREMPADSIGVEANAAAAEQAEMEAMVAEEPAPARRLTKEEIMQLSYDDLLALDLDVLMAAAETVGMSMDDLLNMAMNRQATIASRKAESIFESPVSTYVVTAEDIAQSGYSHIPELFHLVPGALVRQKTNGNFDVTFHGMDNVPPENPMVVRENSTVLLMIDGRVVYDQFSGGIFWETLPVSVNDIERIDVIIGAAAALYGPNAMTGVVNIITKGAAIRTTAKGMAAYGMNQKADAMLNVGIPIAEGWSARVTGYVQHTDRFEKDYYSLQNMEKRPAEEQVDYFLKPAFLGEWNERRQRLGLMRYGGTGGFYFHPKEDFSGSLVGGAQQSQAQTSAYSNMVTPLNLRVSSSFFGAATVNYKQLHLQGDVTHTEIDLDEGKRTPYNTSFETTTISTIINGSFDVGYGLSFLPEIAIRHTKAEDSPSREDEYEINGQMVNAPNYMAEEESLTDVSASLRVEYVPIEHLRLIGALRYDLYTEIQQHALSYQVVAAYAFNARHNLRANYSRASRGLFHTSLFADLRGVPTMNSNFLRYDKGDFTTLQDYPLNETVSTLTLRGNENLKAPRLDLYEIGYRGNFNRYAQFDAMIFYQDMRHFDAPEFVDLQLVLQEVSPGMYKPYFTDERQYENLSLKARQLGLTVAFTSMPHEMVRVNTSLTAQRTWLSDYKVATGRYTDEFGKVIFEFEEEDRVHENTPMLFGNLMVDVIPLRSKKLHIAANLIWRTNQVAEYTKMVNDAHPTLTQEIGGTAWLDVSVSYQFLPGLTAFGMVQNIGNGKEQYAFDDVVDITAFGGIRLDF